MANYFGFESQPYRYMYIYTCICISIYISSKCLCIQILCWWWLSCVCFEVASCCCPYAHFFVMIHFTPGVWQSHRHMVAYLNAHRRNFPKSRAKSPFLLLKESYCYILLGKFHHDLTVLPNPGIMVYVREIIPSHGLNSGERNIIIYPDLYIYIYIYTYTYTYYLMVSEIL